MKKLDYVQWDITSICNLNCVHCREKATVSDAKNDMTLSECKALIDQIVEFNTHTLSIAGGEPLMSPNIWEVLEYASGKFQRLVVSTNGTVMDADMAHKLKEYVTNIQISLDGSTAETHDAMRGVGNFEKSTNCVRFLSSIGVPVAIRLTLHSGNKNEVLRYVDLAKELGLSDAYLRRVIPTGNAVKYNLETLSSYELQHVIGSAISYGKEIGIHVGSADYFCQISFNEESRKKAIATQEMNGKHIGGCAIGFNSFYVMQNGVIAYCPYLPVFCGDLRKQSLNEIWENSEMMKVARSLRENLQGKCATCDFKYACGGCRAYAYAETGNILAEDSGCWIRT